MKGESTARRDTFVENILQGADKSIPASVMRGLLVPPALLHRWGLEAYLLPYRTGLRKRYKLPVPVVAIGNLSSGGTGKTPMAALVAGHLQASGKRVVLLSRGHGGSGEASRVPRIVSDGEIILLGPNAAGDEPTLLARLLPGVPVLVGRDRRQSGRLAVERFAPEVIVLDDALQFWQLERDLNIVLLDARFPFDNGWVLPRGLLREPPSHLTRAGIVVLTRADRVDPEIVAKIKQRVQTLAPQAQVFTAVHAPLGWVRAGDEASAPLLSLNELSGKPVRAFSGIADGNAFIQTVAKLGVSVTETHDYGDHHAYTATDIADLATTSDRIQAVVTTEKDLVKVGPIWPHAASPLYALRVGMKIENAPAFFACLNEVLKRKAPLAF